MKISRFGFLVLPAMLFAMSSCLGDDGIDEDYREWYDQNDEYIKKAETSGEYQKIVPAWDKGAFVLMKWHNDRLETENNLSPLDNSTVKLKYMLTNINGDTIDSSYSLTDSLYECKPNDMVTGFWVATTNMHVGDSVTAVVPFGCGYGVNGSGAIPPYSTLIFQIKLDSIVSLFQ